jgi:hypothetical protein
LAGLNLSALRGIQPHEYLVRFLFGGSATVLAGIIARHYGPGIGGLFLAFPAIFPASMTLIDSHQKKQQQRLGQQGSNRGRMAAAIDGAGAALGAVGLIAFALVLWRFLPAHNAFAVIAAGTALWMGVSYALWKLRQYRHALVRALR